MASVTEPLSPPPDGFDFLTQMEWGGRQMAAANERGEKAAAGRKAGGRVKVARGEMGVWERYSAKEVEGERAGE